MVGIGNSALGSLEIYQSKHKVKFVAKPQAMCQATEKTDS